MKNSYFITTPIYYPNDIPHIGHAYTTIACDVIARWNRMLGKNVLFSTGVDEHGKKILEVAQKNGKAPRDFVTELIPKFKDAWQKLNISYDDFIRTDEDRHKKNVQEILQKVYDNGDIYLGEYEGLYCVGCERYYTEKELEDGNCPIHKKPAEKLKEKSYFFKLSKYKDKLLKYYEDHPEFLKPSSRRNEIISKVSADLRDFSISRTSFDWGIKLPFNEKHICYVWFDALLNYYTIGKEKNFWPADLHVMAKDIFWFHSVYWPAMLMSIGLPLPKQIFSHGFWTFDGEKISKSRGKIINIDELIGLTDNPDSARYFLMRQVALGDDGDFSEKALIDRHNNELLNKFGNLITRTATLIEKNGMEKTENHFMLDFDKINNLYNNLEIDKVLNEIFAFIDSCNEYLQAKKPWESKDKKILYEIADSIKQIAIFMYPIIPATCEKIAKQFNFELTLEQLKHSLEISDVKKSDYLFTRVEYEKFNKATVVREIMEGVGIINFEDWTKIDLKVGQIMKVETIENADKLYKLSIDLGEEKQRTILSGLKEFYSADKLYKMKIIVISNLAPRKMRGVMSEGMLLAAVNSDESKCVLISPSADIENGSKVC